MTARSKQEDKHFIHTIIIEIGRTQQQCWFFRFFVYGCIKSLLPFLLQQVLQCRVVLDALQFITYNLLDLILDAVVVVADCLLHDVIAVGIGEVGNDGSVSSRHPPWQNPPQSQHGKSSVQYAR